MEADGDDDEFSALLEALYSRFNNEFDLGEQAVLAICATFSNPKYKNRWGTDGQCKEAQVVFKNEFRKLNSNNSQPQESQLVHDHGDDDLVFIRAGPTQSEGKKEIDEYFADPATDFKMLQRYPTVIKMFFRYNTQLPSSATVERMFSFATMLNDPRRRKMLPENFESSVLMKANATFENREY